MVIRGSGACGIRKNGVALDEIADSRSAESTNAGLFSLFADLDIADSVRHQGTSGDRNLDGTMRIGAAGQA